MFVSSSRKFSCFRSYVSFMNLLHSSIDNIPVRRFCYVVEALIRRESIQWYRWLFGCKLVLNLVFLSEMFCSLFRSQQLFVICVRIVGRQCVDAMKFWLRTTVRRSVSVWFSSWIWMHALRVPIKFQLE